MPSRECSQFITLVAHDIEPASILRQELGGIVNSFIFAKSQVETTAAIANILFNLILIDVDLNGLGILATIKKPDCINSDAPIIALVNDLNADQARDLIAAGFDDCMAKPLTKDIVSETISFWQKSNVLVPYLVAVETLLDKSLGNKALTLTLYTKLFEELPQQINLLEEAFKNKDYQLAFNINHKLNGSAKTCYLQIIEELANDVERSLAKKNYEFAEGYFWMLRQQAATFMGHRQKILGHLAIA